MRIMSHFTLAKKRVAKTLSLTALGLVQLTLVGCTFAEPEVKAVLQKPTANYQDIIPLPVKSQQNRGYFSLSYQTEITINDKRLKSEQIFLRDLLKQSLGFELKTSSSQSSSAFSVIALELDTSLNLPEEGYELEVTNEKVILSAATSAGVFRGIQSLRQLLPAVNTKLAGNTPKDMVWTIYTGKITDQPRYSYRGFMLDVSRHFYTVEEVKSIIDSLAEYKYNVFHFHLTDDQGWRIEIPGWPKLTTVGSRSAVGMDDCKNCYYTLDEYADIVAYADQRHIMLIPEIDTPGHVRAAQASYPEILFCDGDPLEWPYTGIKVKISSLCFKNAEIYDFFEDVVAAIAPLTTGSYIHVGGDETPKWVDKKDYETFMVKAEQIINKYGKTMMGWTNDLGEVKGLSSSSVGQHWSIKKTCCETTLNMIENGSKIVMSPANKTYVDLKYNKDTELGLKWAGFNSVENSYNWNPATIVPGVTDKDIIGVESPLWGETVKTIEDAQYLIFPRLLTISEVAWSPQESRDYNSIKNRLDVHIKRLKQQGINVHQPQ